MSILKPCPFCGGEPVLKQYNETDNTVESWYPEEIEDELDCIVDTYTKCKICGCELELYETARRAIEAWNRRAE